MRVLFDQATPVPIRAFLAGHAVSTAAQEGWDRLEVRRHVGLIVAAVNADVT